MCPHTCVGLWKLAYFCNKSEIKLGSKRISTYEAYLFNMFPYRNLNLELFIFDHTFLDTFHSLQMLPSSKVKGIVRDILYIVHVTREMDTFCRCLLRNFCYSPVCFCDARCLGVVSQIVPHSQVLLASFKYGISSHV